MLYLRMPAMLVMLAVSATSAYSTGASRPAIFSARAAVSTPAALSRVVMQEGEAEVEEVVEEAPAPAVATMEAPEGWEEVMWSPEKVADIRIEGGKTLKTFKMPADAERVQYVIKSPNGRPLKARAELWIGPIRCVHEMIYDCIGGIEFPLKATLKFKKLSPVLKIMTDGEQEFPLEVGVFVPSPAESKAIGAYCEDEHFYNAPLKDKVQGGSTIDSKGGAIRSFTVDPTWDQTQIMVWSKDVGKKSFKTNIEVLQGPNNPKQFIDLRCGGSTQPYHAVIDTPGNDWIIRCNSKKFVEDGLFEIAIGPYGPTSGGGDVPVIQSGF